MHVEHLKMIQKPWINKRVKSLRRKQKMLFKRQRKTSAGKDIRHYKETEARLQKAERQSYWKYHDNLIEVGDPGQEHQPKPKILFSFVKSLQRDNSGIAPLKEHGRLQGDPKDKADILDRQYESTWTKQDKDDIPNPNGKSFPPMRDSRVTEERVLKLLLKLNPAKSYGPDSIPTKILKKLQRDCTLPSINFRVEP